MNYKKPNSRGEYDPPLPNILRNYAHLHMKNRIMQLRYFGKIVVIVIPFVRVLNQLHTAEQQSAKIAQLREHVLHVKIRVVPQNVRERWNVLSFAVWFLIVRGP
jgi:hypothetical protein